MPTTSQGRLSMHVWLLLARVGDSELVDVDGTARRGRGLEAATVVPT